MKNFKDSGIEWLGKIPEHWKLIKCKNFFVLKSIPIGDLWNKTKLLSLTLNGVIERDINNPEGKFPSDFSTYQIVKEGDLIFCLFDVAETPRTIGLSKLNGMITSAYTIFEIKNQEKRFLEYFFINLDNRKNLKFLYRGLRNTISKEDLLNLKIPLPPLKEQEQIANFLDEKCEQIANFIEKKEKLISLLKEQKQVLINETITKGLDKNVTFKDSDIEWLEEIPQHWNILKLKHIASLRNQKSNNIDFRIGLENIESKTGKFIPSSEVVFEEDGIGFKKGDILFGKLRPYLAKVFLTDRDGICVSEFLVLKIKSESNKFIKFLMLSSLFIDIVDSSTYGTKMPRANWEFIGNLKIPLPPLKEQEQIANFLDEKCEKIDLLIEKTKKQIKLIKEYKTTLINQAVCGRIGKS
ncbi:restriction endonuclease subunit S [Campylobacter jejuni]|uniref:restriction endonuclease subunit S n=1 Tax=Campylobacter jejuni TaxID=197 RepID=UPI0012D0C318|nr:restriction endonuclease subunit S [Campylobacter jejuni]EAI8440533.1 restriction endonuclease subunit S [Campylobacter jejuni]EAL6236978.1 restriction endonuclease subunit S [Campylobacter jejuni]ECJ8326297.1 restriction endonuclease subunit S [Campylobacter jejuni]ECP8999236.1 restriction endonuclease subunit S [Campylobacter jejuni]ECQ8820338.1 restriction endonuclease subunit S [Campylobacter jejuni]